MTRDASFTARGGWWVVAQVSLLVLAVVLPPWSAGVESAFGYPLQVLGWILTGGGALLLLAGVFALGRALTPFPRPNDKAAFVTRGVYRLVRHPIYTGVTVGAFGWALVHLSVVGVLCAVVIAVFFDRKVVREERWLRERFPEYDAYAQRVRKFIPGLY
jgi:protein-S-isoprenylcysteine O-methyltransferase Ste14